VASGGAFLSSVRRSLASGRGTQSVSAWAGRGIQSVSAWAGRVADKRFEGAAADEREEEVPSWKVRTTFFLCR